MPDYHYWKKHVAQQNPCIGQAWRTLSLSALDSHGKVFRELLHPCLGSRPLAKVRQPVLRQSCRPKLGADQCPGNRPHRVRIAATPDSGKHGRAVVILMR